MAHLWDAGVLSASSWHGLEEIGVFTDAKSQIDHGKRTGAWPVNLRKSELRTPEGLLAPDTALVADYANHPARVVGVNGARYRSTQITEWEELCQAAVAAGGTPTGAFSLAGGARILATFAVGNASGLRTQLVLTDSFDGSLRLTCGTTSVRVVCANTLSAAMSCDGRGMAQLRHTASLESKVKILADSVGEAVSTGQKVRAMFEAASDRELTQKQAQAAFDALFPPAPAGATPILATRLENERADARQAAALQINKVGERGSNLATLWNAATYLIDRHPNGAARACRGGADRLNSLLFGARSKRLEQIQAVIEVVMADGSVQDLTVSEAAEAGVDQQQVGSSLLAQMLEG